MRAIASFKRAENAQQATFQKSLGFVKKKEKEVVKGHSSIT